MVSIPFKRESLSKVDADESLRKTLQRFNSLQTGKPIQRRKDIMKLFIFACFNSLQTGKPIQRARWRAPPTTTRFKFQFPSNGKAYPKIMNQTMDKVRDVFQFPSNGKAYPKIKKNINPMRLMMWGFNSLQTGKPIQSTPYSPRPRWNVRVSIPFKRESLSKEPPTWRDRDRLRHKFQFPSNGKAYPKDLFLSNYNQLLAFSFNSLQTGKPIQREKTAFTFSDETISFNSLQTGKPIQRCVKCVYPPTILGSFNSLQTGKPIQRKDRRRVQNRVRCKFQFPSNGKAYPKNKESKWLGVFAHTFQFPSNGKAYPKM